jgi:glycosyltransferase involved in cell wall biosynthesis
VNAATLAVGGGIQIGVSFIEIASRRNDIEFIFLVSEKMFESLPERLRTDKRVQICSPSPARLLFGRKSRALLRKVEKEFAPDLVYSIGFPSYTRFRSIEIGRYTNPWEINVGSLPWHIHGGTKKKLKVLAGILYRQMWARSADFIETQTDAAKKGINKRIHFPAERIKVIPNSPNSLFIQQGNALSGKDLFREKKNIIFCLAAGHPHKNLDIVPFVANELKSRYDFRPEFLFTLPANSSTWKKITTNAAKLGVEEMVRNLEPLKMKECLFYYKESKIVFLPTLLEVFSATYLEAMAMRTPIVTTDLDFARDNCRSGALYYQAYKAADAARKINEIMNDETLYNKMIKEGLIVLESYPSPEDKFENLIRWFKEIANTGNQ